MWLQPQVYGRAQQLGQLGMLAAIRRASTRVSLGSHSGVALTSPAPSLVNDLGAACFDTTQLIVVRWTASN